jgi:hypothetical protein
VTRLKQYLIFNKGADVKQVALELCRIDNDKIPSIVDQVQHQINVKYIFQVVSMVYYPLSAKFFSEVQGPLAPKFGELDKNSNR